MSRFTRRTVLSAGLIAAGANCVLASTLGFSLRGSVKSVIVARQSAICHLANFGASQVLMLVINGAPVEIHARRNGIYYPKDPANSQSVRSLAPVDFNRLMTAAGGIDQPVRGSVRADDFDKLYNSLKPVPLSRACIDGKCRTMGKGLNLPIADTFFRDWSFAHDPSGPFLAFSSPTVKAVWLLES